MTEIITLSDVQDKTQNFWDLIETVPFGNSDFQARKFVAQKWTSPRTQRQILLELWSLVQKMNTAGADRKRAQLALSRTIKRLETAKEKGIVEVIEDETINVEEQEFKLKTEEKLFEDAVRNVNVYIGLLNELAAANAKEAGKDKPFLFTREQFEEHEGEYYKRLFINDAKLQSLAACTGMERGTLEGMMQIGLPVDQMCLDITDAISATKTELTQQKKAALEQGNPKKPSEDLPPNP